LGGTTSKTGRGTAVPYVPALDGFRGYAILAVVVLHLFGASGVLAAERGTAAGVLIWGLLGNSIDAFVIISGFVLFLPTVVRRGAFGSLGDYAIARAGRLFPAYWVSLALALVLVAFVPLHPPSGLPSPFSFTANVTGLQNPARLIDPSVASGFGANGPLWLISVLVGFYLVLPLVAGPYYRHPVRGLVLSAAVALLWKEAALHASGDLVAPAARSEPAGLLRLAVTDQLPGWAFSFALGMTAAWVYVRARYRHKPGWIASRALVVALAAAPVYVGASYLYGRAGADAVPLLGGAVARSSPLTALAGSASRATLIVAIVLAPAWVARPFVNGGARWLAERSLGLYLAHGLFITVAAAAFGLPTDGSPAAAAAWAGTVLPVSLACACLSYRYVEQPVMRWVRGRGRRAGPVRPDTRPSPVRAG
jgi:peptidoglycan/LPS O-acetylase OafA/YrhL